MWNLLLIVFYLNERMKYYDTILKLYFGEINADKGIW